jgi:hypothetical protein
MSQQSLFPGSEESSSSPGASPVRTSARRGEAWDSSEESGVPYGWKCSGSSEGSTQLGSSLRTFLLSALAGLTPFSLAWRRRVTPRGRWWWVLGRSGLRTGGTESGLLGADWASPTMAMLHGFCRDPEKVKAPSSGGHRRGHQGDELRRQAEWEWATSTRRDEKGPGPKHTKGGRDLATDAAQEWPTPTAEPYGSNQGGSSGRVGPVRPSLEGAARDWPTPTVTSHAQTAENPFPGQTGHTTLPGAILEEEGFPVGPLAEANRNTPGSRPGSLNPDWVEALMGAPPGWTDLPEDTVSRLWATRIRRSPRS